MIIIDITKIGEQDLYSTLFILESDGYVNNSLSTYMKTAAHNFELL